MQERRRPLKVQGARQEQDTDPLESVNKTVIQKYKRITMKTLIKRTIISIFTLRIMTIERRIDHMREAKQSSLLFVFYFKIHLKLRYWLDFSETKVLF
ncbi:unnamed protein product [Heterobilharzia americana]|nr:unnamed protein product [Heterobilharzia americana]